MERWKWDRVNEGMNERWMNEWMEGWISEVQKFFSAK